MTIRAISRQPKNINAQLVDTIGRRIIASDYGVGERLPIEADLCLEFGVSRSVLREAIKILMAKGLLVSRARVGTVVTPRSHWNMLDGHVLNWLIETVPENRFLDMLFEVRLGIEPMASELAAVNGSDVAIQKIGVAYESMKNAPTKADLIDPDLRFHQAIMDATANPMLSFIGSTLHSALAFSIELTSRHPDTYALSLPRHKAVYDAIARRDPEAARAATISLLKDSRDDFDAVSNQATV
jgi:DNA-binding FadR family transcriptional regulator